MMLWRAWLFACLALMSGVAHAAPDVGVVTLVEGPSRVLRGVTWYKLGPGARVEDGDILQAGERAQINIEFIKGNVANLVGPGQLYLLPPATGKAVAAPAPPSLVMSGGWLKIIASPPGAQIRAATADIATADGIVVVRAQPLTLEFFMESGTARVNEVLANGASAPAHEAKRGEYWAKTGAVPFTVVPRPPKQFVDAIPPHFVDPLPSLVARFKTKPTLVVDGEVSYAEAEPWLATRDRAVFERRFGSRLRDPVFRKAAEPNSARYPMWDRILHPEKYLPKPEPVK
jgi:hypothetical protein